MEAIVVIGGFALALLGIVKLRIGLVLALSGERRLLTIGKCFINVRPIVPTPRIAMLLTGLSNRNFVLEQP
jgi:hypothetical protein